MPACDLLIRGGRVVAADNVAEMDIAIAGGRIAEIGPALSLKAVEEINAHGLLVLPGLIDGHVHFNEPGRTDWEGFATGSSALAAGGGICFVDMPLNSTPPTLDGESFDAKCRAAEASSLTDFAFWGGLTPGNLDRLEELADRGVIGFKAFMCDSGIDEFARADDLTLLRGMEIAARLRLPVAVHAESHEITERLTAEIRSRRSASDWKAFVQSRPPIAEIEAIQRAILMAEATSCALHVVHVSTARGVDLVDRSSRLLGIDVTCETCPHYLALTEANLPAIGAAAKCAPPLRSAEESRALWQRLASGFIHYVASDHSPAPSSMKQGDDAFAIWGGIAGVQSTLGVLLSGPIELPPSQLARVCSTNVAERLRIKSKGRIEVGFDADLALIDPTASYTLVKSMLLDRHKLSPYIGRKFRGVIRQTILRGRTIMRDGAIVSDAHGRLIKPDRGGAHA